MGWETDMVAIVFAILSLLVVLLAFFGSTKFNVEPLLLLAIWLLMFGPIAQSWIH